MEFVIKQEGLNEIKFNDGSTFLISETNIKKALTEYFEKVSKINPSISISHEIGRKVL